MVIATGRHRCRWMPLSAAVKSIARGTDPMERHSSAAKGAVGATENAMDKGGRPMTFSGLNGHTDVLTNPHENL
jgi:hypothetical protein